MPMFSQGMVTPSYKHKQNVLNDLECEYNLTLDHQGVLLYA